MKGESNKSDSDFWSRVEKEREERQKRWRDFLTSKRSIQCKRNRSFSTWSPGAVLGVTILLIGMAVSPTTAQRDKFGEITCTGLTVLNPNGTSAVIVGVDDDGGLVGVYGKGRESYAAMHTQEHGGIVGLYNEYGGVLRRHACRRTRWKGQCP